MHKQQPLRWEEIVNKNTGEPEIPINENEAKLSNKQGTFDRTEILFNRIRIENTQEGVKWACIEEGCEHATNEKQKIRNHMAMIQRKTNTGFVYCQ